MFAWLHDADADPGTPQITRRTAKSEASFARRGGSRHPIALRDPMARVAAAGAVIALNLANVYIDVASTSGTTPSSTPSSRDSHEFFSSSGIFSILAFAAVVISVYCALSETRCCRSLAPLDDRALMSQSGSPTAPISPAMTARTPTIPTSASRTTAALHRLCMALSLALTRSCRSCRSCSSCGLFGAGRGAALRLGHAQCCRPIWCGARCFIRNGTGSPSDRPAAGAVELRQQRFEPIRSAWCGCARMPGIAFYRGEGPSEVFAARFAACSTIFGLMVRRKKLNWFTSFYGQAAVIFPYLVAAPRYFSAHSSGG